MLKNDFMNLTKAMLSFVIGGLGLAAADFSFASEPAGPAASHRTR